MSSESASTEQPSIPVLETKNAYVKAMNAEGLTIIEGTAAWCPQCKAIAPEVAKMAAEFPKAKFYTFDVEENPDVAQELGVSVMPTFTIFKDGDLMESVSGAKAKALREAVEKNL
jgi:thioredoxin 1